VDLRRILIGAACAAFIASAGGASAAVITATYTGLVSPGSIDVYGFYGAAGSNIGGMGYTAVFQYDPALGSMITDTAVQKRSEGGAFFGNNSPMITSLLTINGQTIGIAAGSYVGTASVTSNGIPGNLFQLLAHDINDLGGGLTREWKLYEEAISPTIPLSLSDPFFMSSLSGSGQFSFRERVNGSIVRLETFDLTINSISVTSDAPTEVPEPHTLSIVGAGMAIAATVRRRKTKLLRNGNVPRMA
jgi:hypothetical protein